MDTVTLEHVDPRNGVLVSGLCNEFNEIFADRSYNCRKSNRFVPYRVCNYPAPINEGDVGEFLIGGEWVVCEFLGPEWWEESNRIGNANTKGGKVSSAFLNNGGQRHIERCRRAGSIGGKAGTPAQLEVKSLGGKSVADGGEKHIERSRRGGSAAGKVTGKKNGPSTNKQLWMSTKDGFISSPSGVAVHNKFKKWSPGARVRLTPEESAFIFLWE